MKIESYHVLWNLVCWNYSQGYYKLRKQKLHFSAKLLFQRAHLTQRIQINWQNNLYNSQILSNIFEKTDTWAYIKNYNLTFMSATDDTNKFCWNFVFWWSTWKLIILSFGYGLLCCERVYIILELKLKHKTMNIRTDIWQFDIKESFKTILSIN